MAPCVYVCTTKAMHALELQNSQWAVAHPTREAKALRADRRAHEQHRAQSLLHLITGPKLVACFRPSPPPFPPADDEPALREAT